jgi:hypothetical protein
MPESKQPNDQEGQNESYSLDEMMRKLQERPEEKGELVTREDGTVAYKIRKKKRRSEQPKKERAKRVKKIRLIQLAVVFFAIVAIVLACVGMLFHVNSSAFREKLKANIERTTGATVEMVQFSVQPTVARTYSMHLAWPAGNHLRELDLQSIDASLDLVSFFQKRWGGRAVLAKTGSLRISMGELDQDRVVKQELEDFPFSFQHYRIERLNCELLGKDRLPWAALQNMEASISKTPGGTQLRTSGGQIDIKGFGKYTTDRSNITFENGTAKFARLGLIPSSVESGLAILSGNVDLYSPDPISFELLLESFPINQIMAHEMGQFFKGGVDTNKDALSRYLRFRVGEANTLEVKASFSGSENQPFTLVQLPFLRVLSQAIANQELLNGYVFADVNKGELLRTAEKTIVKDLYLSDRGNIAVRGTLSSDGKKLEGELFLGVGSEILNRPTTNPDLRKVFLTEDDGYLWTAVKVSGSPGSPVDDFADKIDQAGLNRSPKPSSGSLPVKPTIEGELE